MKKADIPRRLTALALPVLLLAGCGTQADSAAPAATTAPAATAAPAATTAPAATAAPAAPAATTAPAATAAASQTDEVPTATGEIFAMDTYMTITCYGDQCEDALAAAKAEIERLDDLLSVGSPDSEISVINQNGSGPVSDDTAAMVDTALDVYASTGGAFDITVYPLMELWGFTSGNFAVPSDEALAETMAKVGSDTVRCENGQVTLAEGQGIDLGGIAKGFTSDRLMEIFARYDLTAGLVSLGGNVQFYGTKPDGTAWRCGIQDPNAPDSGSFLGILTTGDSAVITSGAYERYFTDEATGQTYHHILDPSTGLPARTGLTSVSVVTPHGMLADALSTSCYVMGLDKSADYWRQYGAEQDFELILMTEKNRVYVTEGLADSLESEYPVSVITREGIEAQ